MGGRGSLADKVAFEQRWEGREGMSHLGVARYRPREQKVQRHKECLEFWEDKEVKMAAMASLQGRVEGGEIREG